MTETQRGPEDVNVWTMSPERLRYLAQTADMAKPFLSPEQMAALDRHTDPFIGSLDPLATTEALARQRPEGEQASVRPATFADGKYAHITDNGDGTAIVELPTGEKFKGNWQTIAEQQAKSLVYTKRWAREQRAQQAQPAEQIQPTSPNSAVTFAPDGTPQLDFSKIPDVTRWQMDQMAQSLGYSDGAEMVQDQIVQRQRTRDLERRLQEREERDYIVETSSNFLAANPDFPNTDQSIAALEQVINQNGWEWTPENMQAAHALALRQGVYQPLSVEEQNANWEQNLRESNKRPKPPPMVPSGNPDVTFRSPSEHDLYTMPVAELRALTIRQQLGETDGRR